MSSEIEKEDRLLQIIHNLNTLQNVTESELRYRLQATLLEFSNQIIGVELGILLNKLTQNGCLKDKRNVSASKIDFNVHSLSQNSFDQALNKELTEVGLSRIQPSSSRQQDAAQHKET